MSFSKVLLAAEEIKWEQLPDFPPGVMGATIWGDVGKGAYGCFVKFPPGFEAPLHYHTDDLRIVVIKGAYIYTPEGGSAKRFGTGSHVSYPGGDRHSTHGDPNSETIFFMEQPGKFDINFIEAKK